MTIVKIKVWFILRKLGVLHAVEPLIKALGDESAGAREAAAMALGNLGDLRAVEPLILALKKEQQSATPEASISIIKALGKLGDKRAVESLITALGYFFVEVRLASAAVLDSLGEGQWRRLFHDLAHAPQDHSEWEYFERLANSDDHRARIPLISAFEDDRLAAAAAYALATVGDTRAVEPLIKVLTTESDEMAKNAAKTLAKLGDARAVKPLVEMLERKQDYGATAAYALGELGDALAVEPLIKALQYQGEVRCHVIEALGKLGDTRAVEPLIKALTTRSHAEEQDQDKAAAALAKLGDARAVKPLIEMLERRQGFGKAAAYALGKLGDARAVEPLIKALQNRGYDKSAVVWALGQLGDSRAVEPLIRALADDYEYFDVVEALGNLGDTRAVEPLVDSLLHMEDHPDDINAAVSFSVGRALCALGDKRAIILLKSAFAPKNEKIPKAIKGILIALRDPMTISEVFSTIISDDRLALMLTVTPGLFSNINPDDLLTLALKTAPEMATDEELSKIQAMRDISYRKKSWIDTSPGSTSGHDYTECGTSPASISRERLRKLASEEQRRRLAQKAP